MEKLQLYHAKTFKGLEHVLAAELTDLGAERVKPVNRGVDFYGSRALLYKANFCLQTAIRILMPVKSFLVHNDQDLYRKIMSVNWMDYMDLKTSFAIDAVVFSDVFRNSQFVAQKAKDAIVDQFRDRTHLRPSVNLKHPDIRIDIHLVGKQLTLSLDSSGESLHKRGYRVSSHKASMNEVLAAGIIKKTGWREGILINPMCGAGTLAIEAILHATGIPPGVFGRKYAFERWKDYDEKLYRTVIDNIAPAEPPELKVYASDADPEAVQMTKKNLAESGLTDFAELSVERFEDSALQEKPATVIINPPYGERLNPSDLNALYSLIGSTLKHKFPGSTAWIFTSNAEATRFIGLKPGKKITLYNANLECKLLSFDLFAGKRKSAIRNPDS